MHATGYRGEAEDHLKKHFTVSRLNQIGCKMGHDPVYDREVYVAILAK